VIRTADVRPEPARRSHAIDRASNVDDNVLGRRLRAASLRSTSTFGVDVKSVNVKSVNGAQSVGWLDL